MITLLKNLFGRYAARHLHLEQSQGESGFLVRLEQNQIVVSGKLPANLWPVQRLRLATGKLERDTRPDPADGSFSLSAPFSPGPVTLLIEGEAASSEAEQVFVLPGFSSARLRVARLRLVPDFVRRLVLLLPDALRWYRHQDPEARIRLRDALGLAPLDVAPPLDPGILARKEAAPESKSDKVFTPIILIMPVFDAFDDVVEALEHLQRNTSEPWHLVLVEDCSTDPRMRPYLRQWAGAINDRNAAGQVELLENDENVGFIGAVNRGFGRALQLLDKTSDQEGAAIVLLNTDAFLPPNWAARLLSPIKADARVASVTPMSNSGEMLSVPFLSRPVNLAPGLAEAIDKVAASLASFTKGGPDMPTGVGFCMAISLAWLRRVGLFDASFGAGYGEEVDWCQRALALGGRHVSQPALFVEHRGGASFGSEQKQQLLAKNDARLARLYPEFNAQVQAFIAADPLLDPRLVLGLAWAGENARRSGLGPVSVYLAHALGGGAQMDLSRRMQHEIQAGAAVVVLRVGVGVVRWQVELHGTEGVTMGSTDDFEFLRQLMALLPARRLIYSCGVGDRDPAGLPDMLLALGSAEAGGWEVLFHDYLPLSPSYTLLGDDGLYHGLPEPGKTKDKAHRAQRPDGTEVDLSAWRAAWGRLMAAADRIEVFSSNSRDLVAEAYPQQADKIEIRPHAPLHQLKRFPQARTFGGSRVPVIGVLGNIAPHKGAAVLVELSRILARSGQARLVLLGKLDPAFRLARPAQEHGEYAPEDLPALIARYRISAWLMPSIWPETFSFVTHEAIATGLPVFAFDLGAQGDLVRIAARDGRGGVIPIPDGKPDLEFLLARLASLPQAMDCD